MKKIIFSFSLTILIINVFAQVPQSFKYQAVIRNASGEIIANQNIGIKLSILEGSETGTPVYTETWNLTTNQFGLITLNVGEGTSSDDFSTIDWGNNNYWIKPALDETGGTNYVDMGASQLLSVPYALYAGKSSNGSTQWLQNGNDIYYNSGNVGIGTNVPTKKLVIKAENDNDTLLEIQDKYGNPLMIITPQLTKFNFKRSTKGISGGFAVGRYATLKNGKALTDTALLLITPDSARVYTSGALGKGVSGGFAVGRYATLKGKSYVKKSFFTNYDSTRVYTDGTGTKGVSGGFAVGRYATAKGTQNYNFFTDVDNTRVYTGGLTKGVSGGFAVGRYATAKGSSSNYMYMIPENYFIGHQAGDSLQNSTYTGLYNTFFGYKSGLADTSGSDNVFIGRQSGLNNTDGSNNVFMGNESGISNINGTNNVFLGYQSGFYNTLGQNNVFIGKQAGLNNKGLASNWIYGSNNVFLGDEAGFANDTGFNNVFIGYLAGHENIGGYNNVFIGTESGKQNTAGIFNTFMGIGTGQENLTGNSNTFIGDNAGNKSTTANANVYMGRYAGKNNNGSENTFIGTSAGGDSETAYKNVFVGVNAGHYHVNGYWNVIIGNDAGKGEWNNAVASTSNVIIGQEAAMYSKEMRSNVIIGQEAMKGTNANKAEGDYNTILGFQSGYNLVTGNNNVFLGYKAGYNETGSDKLYIDNSNTSDPLIYGDFSANTLHVNGTFTFNSGANSVTLPTSQGSNGYVLTTDGAGNSSWTSPATFNIQSTSSNLTITDNDGVYTVLCTTNAVVVTLPSAGNNKGRVIIVKKLSTSSTRVWSQGSDTIDGATEYILTNQYDAVTFQSDGTNWYIISHNP